MISIFEFNIKFIKVYSRRLCQS